MIIGGAVLAAALRGQRGGSTAVETPRDRLGVASLHFRDCTAVVLQRHDSDGGATGVLVRRS